MSGGSTCIGKGGYQHVWGEGRSTCLGGLHAWGGGGGGGGGATCLAEGGGYMLHAWQRGAATCYMLGRGGRLHATCLAEGGGYMLDRGGDYMLGRGGGYTLGKGRGDYFSSTM